MAKFIAAYGHAFKNGKLYSFSPRAVTVIRGWPEPMAWIKRPSSPVWQGVRPELTYRMLGREYRREEESEYLRREREACKQFAATIPAAVRKTVVSFPARRWHMLQLLARCPGACDLIHSNPALAFCLASNWIFHKPVQRPLRAARHLVVKKQYEMLGWLGFPASKSAAKISRKIKPSALSVSSLLYLRTSMQEPEVMKFLAHVPHINVGVLRLVTDPFLRKHLTPNFLSSVAVDKRSARSSYAAYMFKQAIELIAILHPRWRSCTFRSVCELQSVYNNLINDLARLGGRDVLLNRTLPPHPLPATDDIIPLTKLWQLLEYGDLQNNCLDDYVKRVSDGHVYIYKITYPEPATLSIVLSEKGLWKICELEAAHNQPAQDETYQMVVRWLRETQSAKAKQFVFSFAANCPSDIDINSLPESFCDLSTYHSLI